MSGAQINFLEEIIVDNFAGGGGASTGMELATGRVVDIAINHDPDAILMHRTNHPHTTHYQASVWDVDPVEVCRGRPLTLKFLFQPVYVYMTNSCTMTDLLTKYNHWHDGWFTHPGELLRMAYRHIKTFENRADFTGIFPEKISYLPPCIIMG